jgi:prepilin-type N-terminal cleavage/methylation domain-containing protein
MRRGFTVLEVAIAIFMIAVVSAAVIPALMGRIRDAERSALAQTLFSISLAVVEYRKAVSVNPSQLAHLGTRPAATATDACGTTQIGATNAANWRGPYVTREILTGGVNIGDSQISNSLRRVAGPPTMLFIDVGSVDARIAADLDAQFDGSTSTPTTGTIRYQAGAIGTLPAAPGGTVNLSYGIPITGC